MPDEQRRRPCWEGIRSGTEKAAAATIAALTDDTYDDVMKRIEAGNRAEKESNPWVDQGSQVAGAVGGTIPLMMAAPGAFDAGGGGLMARTAASTASGAALGGADAAVRSDGDLDATGLGVGVGAGIGALGPIAGKAVGAGVRKVMDAFAARGAARAAGTTPAALSQLAETASNDGLTAAEMRTRLGQLGPEGTIMDLGPGLQGQAAGLAAIPGRAQSIVRDAIEARQRGANSRIASAVDQNLGRNVVPSEIQAGVAENQQALSPLYRDAFRSAQRYDLTPIADTLDRDQPSPRWCAAGASSRPRHAEHHQYRSAFQRSERHVPDTAGN